MPITTVTNKGGLRSVGDANEGSTLLDIRDYLVILRRYWWIIVVLTAIGAAVGYATTLILTPKYQSTARLFVTTQSGTSVGEAYQNNMFSQERVVSYAGLAESEQVAARAVDQLKGQISVDELRKKVTAKAVDKTVLLDVSVRDADPQSAQTYANAVADQLVQLVSELETSRRGGTPAAGAVVVDDADYPTSPIGLSTLTKALLGAAAGLLAGIILAVLVGLLDRRLRARDGVERVTGSSVLGVLPAEPDRAKAGVVDLAADGLVAERLRELRTNLRFVVPPGADGPPRVIAMTSPANGDGRTTTAADLAAALAESGRSVVVVDGDLRKPGLADRMALDDAAHRGAAERGLATVLVGEHTLDEALLPNVDAGGRSIALLPAGPVPTRVGELWAADRAPEVLEALRARFDYVIIDTPPLRSFTDGAMVASLVDGAIVLARIRHTSTAALRAGLQALQRANATLIGTVVTGEPGHRRELRREQFGNRARVAESETPAETRLEPAENDGAVNGKPTWTNGYPRALADTKPERG